MYHFTHFNKLADRMLDTFLAISTIMLKVLLTGRFLKLTRGRLTDTNGVGHPINVEVLVP